MSEILEVIDAKGRPIVICSPNETVFDGAKSITIYSKNNKSMVITDFVLDRTKQCFSNKPESPLFRINEKVGDDFLMVGNRVVFNLQKVSTKPVVPRPTAKPVRQSLSKRRELAFA